jgi:hypothetical protein
LTIGFGPAYAIVIGLCLYLHNDVFPLPVEKYAVDSTLSVVVATNNHNFAPSLLYSFCFFHLLEFFSINFNYKKIISELKALLLPRNANIRNNITPLPTIYVEILDCYPSDYICQSLCCANLSKACIKPFFSYPTAL